MICGIIIAFNNRGESNDNYYFNIMVNINIFNFDIF